MNQMGPNCGNPTARECGGRPRMRKVAGKGSVSFRGSHDREPDGLPEPDRAVRAESDGGSAGTAAVVSIRVTRSGRCPRVAGGPSTDDPRRPQRPRTGWRPSCPRLAPIGATATSTTRPAVPAAPAREGPRPATPWHCCARCRALRDPPAAGAGGRPIADLEAYEPRQRGQSQFQSRSPASEGVRPGPFRGDGLRSNQVRPPRRPGRCW
jgi:hypothetical protein